jgi:sortase A
VYNPLVRKAKSPEDLSVDELRRLLVEKRRNVRLQHLERFRRTGRVMKVTPEVQNPPNDYMHSNTRYETSQAQLEASSREHLKYILDRFLLAIEILAVFGLIFVIYSGVRMLRDLNTQFAQDLTPATLTPTPLIVPVVLPSGHTPPNSPGGAQPNQAEIPAHLLPLYQSLAEIRIPTPGLEQAIQIQIPSINVDAPIVQGDSWEQLKKGVAQHIGSSDPGLPGNLVLSAHDDVYGEIFRYLDQMENGDQIIIYSAQHSFTYYVTSIEIVGPTDVEVMAPTSDATITLISCYPYMVDNKRIVVQGSFQGGSK